MLSVVCLAGLLFSVGAQFFCNSIKIKEQCDGIIASDGICEWQGIYCSAGAPAPSPAAVPAVTAPELVCPPTAGEAACIYDPCGIGEICYANTDAVCVVNTCIGAVEYLGTFLTEPCSAVYVNITSMEVQACNVKEIVRLPTEIVDEETDAVPEEATPAESQTVSGSSLGLPSLDDPSLDDPSEVPTMPVSLPPAEPAPNGLASQGVLGLTTIGDEEDDETDEDAPLPEPLN